MTNDFIHQAEIDKDKSINPMQLDVECVRQGDLVFKWAKLAIQAKKRAKDLELDLKLKYAKLQRKVRTNPDAYGLPSITEASVKAAVESSPEYIALFREIIAADEQHEYLVAAVNAIETKKRMLGELVTLHGQQYFSGPSIPNNLAELWRAYQAGQEASNDKLRGKTRVRNRDKE